ncbi:MAG: DNA polymerase I [Chloroflexi bacterium]|nr:DNA polymerase I [Chloroflexota bacterium]
MPSKLYLIDGHALAYRTFFALTSGAAGARWQTSSGEPTAGIYGFATVLMRLLESDRPDYIAVAFDTGKTFRDELFPEYKATRAKMPDDLRPQIERIRQMVDAFNIPRLEMEGFEADDVLGSIAKQAAAQGLGVKIITGDRDLLQLVGDHIIVNLPEGGKLADARDFITDDDVRSKFGVPARLVVDYKALVGDASDNIPGVKGVGEKTAQTLFETYTSLDDIYTHLDQISPKVREKLELNREMAYLSRDLAQIRVDLPIKLDLEHAKADQFDVATVEKFFREMEFRTLVPKVATLLGGGSAATATPASAKNGQLSLFGETSAPARVVQVTAPVSGPQTEIVDTTEKLNSLVEKLKAAEIISFDTETTSVDEMQAELVGISLAMQAGFGWYIPVGHLEARNLPLDQVLAALTESLTNPAIPKIGHNVKYDYLVLARRGLRVAPLSFDTMIAEWVIDPNSHNLGLKNLALVRLGEEMTHIEELIGKGKHQLSMAQVPVEAAAPYAAADAETCLRLMPQQQAEIKRDGLDKLLYEMEMPLVSVLAEMEQVGVLLDLDFFHAFSKELTSGLATLETQIFEQVGKPFNINSTQQLSDVLFSRLKLTPPDRGRKTASGHFSTAANVLDEMRGQHAVVDLILEHRELSKLKSTYVDALPAAVDANTGRVHTSYSQTGAVTGRLSSNNPNLQNIPTRTETGRRVRNGFIADEGNVLLSVDYSQVELRLVAQMAGDEAMLDAFRAGQDIHSTTAAAIYSVPLAEVTKDMRRHAKAINFGLIYGMSAFGLTRSTELTLGESEAFVKAYFARFPGVKKYLDGTKRLAAELGYVTTLLGRRRYFPALQGSLNQQVRGREEREAINAPIQGTAADIMKLAMLRIPGALQEAGLKGQMLLQVHDEIVIECPQSELKQTAEIVQKTMETAYPLSIPLSTEARWGKSWGAMQVLRS